MIRDDDLEAAIGEGVIDRVQAIRLRHLAETRRQAEKAAGFDAGNPTEDARPVDPDEERFRLIGGFNDVFVAIGVALLAGALLGLSRVIGFRDAFAAVALLAAWGLSEVFARRMRLALPSILLGGMFAGAAGALVLQLVLERGLPPILHHGWVPAAFAFSAAALLHHWRFRVPIDIALAVAGGIGALLALLLTLTPELTEAYFNLLLLGFGLCVFALALRTDMSDPERVTRRSDAAFWLHLLAAALIVHPAFRSLLISGKDFGTGQALLVLGIFLLLGLIALVIDRRALLVSALSYAGIAVAYLISQNVSANLSLPLALLGLAVLVLALSAGWRSLRGLLLPRLPLGRLRDRLPPVEALPA